MIKQETNSRWPGICAALGIEIGESGKHTACPICGPGKNSHRFRFDDKEGEGTWICTQCGAGDGISLVMKVLNLDFKEAVREIRKVIGTANVSKPQKEKTISKELLRKIYTESRPVSLGDPVFQYLHGRGLRVTSDKLRYHPTCYEPETHTKMPAMLATFTAQDGTAITMHRTFLTKYGNKANIKNPKKVLPSLQDMAGGSIRLFEPRDGIIGVAEGIETALAVHQSTNMPMWSLVSSSLMAAFEPPTGIKTVLIFADNDLNFIGAKSAYILANRLVNKGLCVEVHIPKSKGDYLDEILSD